MKCSEAEKLIPGYLDGAMDPGEHTAVRKHMELCAKCRGELESYRRLAVCLAQLDPVLPPSDLATRIRIEAARRPSRWAAAERLWTRVGLVFENILEPMAVPATGGILTALVVFALVVQNILVGVPLGTVPNDLPLNLVQPARLERLAPFPVPEEIAVEGQPSADGLLVDATLNAQGEVMTYRILSGPNDAAAQRELDQVLLFSRFRPLVSFGLPLSGGHVVLSFNQVRVRG